MKDWSIWLVIITSLLALIVSSYKIFNNGNKKTNITLIIIFGLIFTTGLIRLFIK